jgi:hypothetical protein
MWGIHDICGHSPAHVIACEEIPYKHGESLWQVLLRTVNSSWRWEVRAFDLSALSKRPLGLKERPTKNSFTGPPGNYDVWTVLKAPGRAANTAFPPGSREFIPDDVGLGSFQDRLHIAGE